MPQAQQRVFGHRDRHRRVDRIARCSMQVLIAAARVRRQESHRACVGEALEAPALARAQSEPPRRTEPFVQHSHPAGALWRLATAAVISVVFAAAEHRPDANPGPRFATAAVLGVIVVAAKHRTDAAAGPLIA